VEVIAYVYDGDATDEHVKSVLAALADRPEEPRVVNVATGDPADARREAMLVVRQAVRVGSAPEALFGESGTPDFSAGALVTEADTGRRTLHVGADAAAALDGGENRGN
jgi:hypothetical protein